MKCIEIPLSVIKFQELRLMWLLLVKFHQVSLEQCGDFSYIRWADRI